MPYDNRNLQIRGTIPSNVLTGAGGQPVEAIYVTDDAIATVIAANYFNPGASFFGVGVNALTVIAAANTGTPVRREFSAVRSGSTITLTPASGMT